MQINTITHEHGKLVWIDRPGGNFEILDIEVSNEHRREGIGRIMVETLFTRLGTGKRVFAITRPSNEIAQQFYEDMNFEVCGILRRFYGNEAGADAVVYARFTGGPV